MVARDSEPWQRGPLTGVPVAVQPLFYTFQQVREEIERAGKALSAAELWTRPGGAASFGFHMRHIGGSVERLLTYLEGADLNERQQAYLKAEGEARGTFEELYSELTKMLAGAEQRLLGVDMSAPEAPRYVGRKRIPVTAHGLLVHIAEHTQRHLGQAVTTARIVTG